MSARSDHDFWVVLKDSIAEEWMPAEQRTRDELRAAVRKAQELLHDFVGNQIGSGNVPDPI